MAETLKTQTVKGVWWSFLERYSTQGVSFLITLIMARLLTPGEYGLIGMLAIFMALGQVFIDGGFANALIQKNNRTETDFSTVFWVNVSIGGLSYILLFVSAPAIASFYNQEILEPIIKVYALNLIFSSLAGVNKAKLTIDINFKTQLKISLISAITSGVTGIACALNGFGVWAIVVQSNVAAAMMAILSFFFVRWKPSFVFSGESFKSLFNFGSKLLAAQIISTIYVNLYNLVIGKKYTTAELGLYTKAGLFGQMVSTNLTSVMTRVSFPVLSKVQNNDIQLMDAYRKFIGMVAFIVFPVALGICGMARPLIVLLITEKWIGCVPLIQILIFAYLCDGITIVNLNLLYVKGKSNVVLKLEIIKKSIAITLLFIAVRYGVKAICLSQVLYAVIALILNTRNTKKILGYGFLHQIRDLIPYFICSLTIMTMALMFDYYISNNWLVLTICIVVCPAVYFLLCYIFKLNALKEMALIVSSNKYCPVVLKRLFAKMFSNQ
ncbi:MAG: lipopolysaccharide biosynthesis protein [Salinivirgaceae bacterium]|nr:lipopolysaccharide biosynthesis protein [Salinivirgaceae bacterium]